MSFVQGNGHHSKCLLELVIHHLLHRNCHICCTDCFGHTGVAKAPSCTQAGTATVIQLHAYHSETEQEDQQGGGTCLCFTSSLTALNRLRPLGLAIQARTHLLTYRKPLCSF